MINSKWFTTRPAVPAHQADMIQNRSIDSGQDGMRRSNFSELDELFSNVFSRKPVVYGGHDQILPAEERAHRQHIDLSDLSLNQFAKLFYHGFYHPPLVSCGTGDGDPLGNDPEESIYYLLDRVFSAKNESYDGEPRNNFFFLVGDVGSGKSAFINNVLSSQALSKRVESGDLWFIRINLEPLSIEKFTIVALCKTLIEKAEKVLDFFADSPTLEGLSETSKVYFRNEKNKIFVKCEDVERSSLRGVLPEHSENQIEQDTILFLKHISAELKRKLCLVIDNSDFVFHKFDEIESLDVSNGNRIEDISIVDNFREHLSEFHRLLIRVSSNNNEWRFLDSSVLMILRNDSYQLLLQLSDNPNGGKSHYIKPNNVFSLVYDTATFPQIILLNRLRYLLIGLNMHLKKEVELSGFDSRVAGIEEIASLDDGSKYVDQIIQNIEKALRSLSSAGRNQGIVFRRAEQICKYINSAKRLIADLEAYVKNPSITDTAPRRRAEYLRQSVRLSGSGMRSVLQAYQPFSWVQHDGEEAMNLQPASSERVYAKPNLSLIVHMLRNKIRFSESACRFPNIFLSLNPEHDGAFAKEPNYWLLSLIVQYVYIFGSPRLDDLLRSFCGDSENEPGYYSRHVVCSAISRMQKVGGARLLRIEKSLSTNGRFSYSTVVLTDRARNMFYEKTSASQRPLVADFIYLQLVIDDPALPVPLECYSSSATTYIKKRNSAHNIESRIEFDDTDNPPPFQFVSGHSYSYLVKDNYAERHIPVMNHKASKIAKFLGIVEAAKFAESKKYGAVWDIVPMDDFPIYDTEFVVKNIASDIRVYARYSDNILSEEKIVDSYNYYRDGFLQIIDTAIHSNG